MHEYFNLFSEVGEMMGSFVLTFAALIAIYLTKVEKYGIDTNLKKRIFLGVIIGLGVVLGLVTAVGFGGHGQINPAVTLMVAGMDEHFEQVPAIIAFQFLGAAMAAGMTLFTVKMWGETKNLKESFTFNKQSPAKSAVIEVVGNILWLLPIAAMLGMMVNAKLNLHGFQGTMVPDTDPKNPNGFIFQSIKHGVDAGNFGHFQLGVAAFAGKFILVAVFEEFGAANFNSQVIMGKWIVTAVSHRGKITKREFLSEGAAFTMTLAIGAALGPLAHVLVNR